MRYTKDGVEYRLSELKMDFNNQTVLINTKY